MTPPEILTPARKLALLALLVFCALLLFYRLGETPVYGDEALYVRVAMSTLHTGNWAPLLARPKAFVEKPPLTVWASAAGMKLLGRNELGARVGVGLAALALCAVTALFGLRIGNTWTMVLAPLVLVSAPGLLLVHGLRSMVPEAWLLLAVTASFLCFLATGGKDPRPRLGGLVLLSLFSGWTKGMVGPLVVGVTLFLVELAAPPGFIPGAVESAGSTRRRVGRAFATATAAALPGILIYFAWMLYSLGKVGDVLLFLRRDLGVRVTSGVAPIHLQPLSIYLDAAWQNFGIFAFLAPLALVVVLVRERAQRGVEAISFRRLILTLLLWITVVFVLFAIPSSRLSWYLFPAYPALALATAFTLDRFRRFLGDRRGGLPLFVLLLSVIFAARAHALLEAWPPREPHSFAALQHRFGSDPAARVYVEPGLVHGTEVIDRVPQWHRFYLLRFIALERRELPAGAPECSFVVTAEPDAWRLLVGGRLAGVTPVLGELPGQLRLFVLDLCGGAFSRGTP